MTLVLRDPYAARHANRAVRTQTGAGTDYIGVRRKPEPDWFLTLLDGVMQANRYRAASAYLPHLERR